MSFFILYLKYLIDALLYLLLKCHFFFLLSKLWNEICSNDEAYRTSFFWGKYTKNIEYMKNVIHS